MLVAAGSGTRLAAGAPKAFVVVGGRTLLEHAVVRVLAAGCVQQLVLVVPAALVGRATELVAPLLAAEGGAPVTASAVAGGLDRSSSVRAGLAALGPDVDVVLVHDAARALAPAAQVAAVAVAVAAGHEAVVPAMPVHDTLRTAGGPEGASRQVDRSGLRVVQTPQGFSRDLLERAHAGGGGATDDAGLVEAAGAQVHLVEGSELAFKVTRPLDLLVAAAVLAGGDHP